MEASRESEHATGPPQQTSSSRAAAAIRREPFIPEPLLGSSERAGPLVLGAAGLLFAAVFALRFAVENPVEGITILYTLPIALLAVAYGVWAGLLGAAFAVALVGIWAGIEDVEVGVLGFLSRTAGYGLLGGLIGWFSDRLRSVYDSGRRQQDQLQAILDNTTAVIYVKDTDGRFLLVNKQFERLFHVDGHDVIGMTDYDLFPRYMADAFRANDRRVIKEGRALETEEIAPQDDGEHTYISVKFPLFDSDGRPYGVCGISTDITERKRVERGLKASKERVREIIDTAHEAFISMDEAGVITTWNKRAEETFGWPRSKAIGRPLADTIIPPEFREAHWRGLERFLKTGEGPLLNKRIELQALHRDGHRFPIELTISALRVEGGYAFNAFLHDISERKRLEEAAGEKAADAPPALTEPPPELTRSTPEATPDASG